MGKCISFSLCVPAAKLYIRAMAREIGRANKNNPLIHITADLRAEILFWRFLDDFTDWVKWREEKPHRIDYIHRCKQLRVGSGDPR